MNPYAVGMVLIGALVGLMDLRNRVKGEASTLRAKLASLEAELEDTSDSDYEDREVLTAKIAELETELAGLKAGEEARNKSKGKGKGQGKASKTPNPFKEDAA